MFTIKWKKYNMEYKGFHLLCVTRGILGHYKDGCLDKNKTCAQDDKKEVVGDGVRIEGRHYLHWNFINKC